MKERLNKRNNAKTSKELTTDSNEIEQIHFLPFCEAQKECRTCEDMNKKNKEANEGIID